jgi:hypothetical protein
MMLIGDNDPTCVSAPALEAINDAVSKSRKLSLSFDDTDGATGDWLWF